jgi:tetratricopeptide (TPR) repeat protein
VSFWSELRRRKVVRATLAYLAAAFAVAQVTQLLIDALDLPENLLRIVVILEIALLPLVIAAAWAFDWSSQGVHQTDSPAPPLRWRRLAPALLATLLLLGGGLYFATRGSSEDLDDNLVAVLPFRVSGSSDIAYLSEGMMDLLAAKLTGEGGPRAADPRSTMSAMKAAKQDASAITEEGARDVARNLGAGYVLLGSVVGTPKQLTIAATLTNVRSGRTVRGERTGSADTLAAFIDHLAAELLSLSAGEDRRLAALTSTSLPALRVYLSAQSDYRAGRFESALRNYRRALEIDSTFALAAMGHILSSGWGAVPDSGENPSRRLLARYASRLGEIDRIMAAALAGPDGNGLATVRQTVDAWETIVSKAPDRSEGWFLYGDAMLHLGALASVPDNREVAMRAFAKSLQIDSAHTPALVHLIDEALLQNDRARFTHLDSIRVRRGTDRPDYQRHVTAYLSDDAAARRRIGAAIDTMNMHELFIIAITPMVYGVGAREAVAALDQLTAQARLPEERAVALRFAHALYLAYGLPSRAAHVAEQRIQTEPKERTAVSVTAIMDALYANGDTMLARQIVDDVSRAPISDNDRLAQECGVQQWKLWRGEKARPIEVARALRAVSGLPTQERTSVLICAQLLESLNAVFHQSGHARTLLSEFDKFMMAGPRADERLIHGANMAISRMWERLGDREAAYRAIARQGFHPAYFHYLAMMGAEQARLAAMLGKRDEAIQLYRHYLALNEAAEPSMKPQLDRIRRDLARLTTENQ